MILWWYLGARDWISSVHAPAMELPLLLRAWGNSLPALVNWDIGCLVIPNYHGCFPVSIFCAVGFLLHFPLSAFPVPVGCAALCHAQGTSHGLCGRAVSTYEAVDEHLVHLHTIPTSLLGLLQPCFQVKYLREQGNSSASKKNPIDCTIAWKLLWSSSTFISS